MTIMLSCTCLILDERDEHILNLSQHLEACPVAVKSETRFLIPEQGIRTHYHRLGFYN